MLEDADGRALLRERRRVTDETVAHCWELPPHTFGGAYAAFMGQRGFRADDRPPVRYVDDAQLAYVATRAREVRRVIHAVTRPRVRQ
jgi:ubiquinone biosynthesis protein COQ4